MSSKKSLTVLAVDLDHTLIHTDMIYLGFKQILFKKLYLMPILLYLLFTKGKPSAKKYLYDKTTFDLKVIPFNTELIKFIKAERHNYDHTILISGSYLDVDLPLSIGFINIPALLIFIPITTFMAKVGANAVHKIEKQKITKFFGIFLLVVGSIFLYRYLNI